jgi:fatty acid desaturase
MRPLDGLAHLAAHKGGTVDAARRRPDPLRWIWYAFGGMLGPRYRQWVLLDLTGRTRWARQIVRGVLQVAPLAAVLLLALGFGWIAWVGVGCGLALALIYSLAYFDPSVEHRLVKHGYAPGTAQRILSERDEAEHPDRMRHYMETYRANTLESNSERPNP